MSLTKIMIIPCLKFICDKNYFGYNNLTYRQTDGLAMGTSVAPLLANIYLALIFDTPFLNQLTTRIKLFRYIDDVLVITSKQHLNLETCVLTAEPIFRFYPFFLQRNQFYHQKEQSYR